MTTTPSSVTAPENRIAVGHRIIYGFGAFVNNLLAAASGGLMVVLNLTLGMDPVLVGVLSSIPRLTDALTDPLMGYISDNTRTRWGRRRPYILAGAILSGLIFILLWQLPRMGNTTLFFYVFLAGSIIFYMAYTIFATPWVALGFELTPDYHERTRLMATQNSFGQIVYMISPWFYWFIFNEGLFPNGIEGASTLAIIVAVVTIGLGILPALFLRERINESSILVKPKTETNTDSKSETLSFFQGFKVTLSCRPFQKLCLATLLVFNGFIMVAAFQYYVLTYYICGGDMAAGGLYAGLAGTVGAAFTALIVIFVSMMAKRLGKRRTFIYSIIVSIFGFALKWVCYNPEMPLLVILPAPLIAFGFGSLFTLVPSMIADVVDTDELETHERREGMFGSIFWWVVKLGMSLALFIGGVLLKVTGFDEALGGDQTSNTLLLLRIFDIVIPIAASALAIWAVYRFPITEAKANAVRATLEARRGKI